MGGCGCGGCKKEKGFSLGPHDGIWKINGMLNVCWPIGIFLSLVGAIPMPMLCPKLAISLFFLCWDLITGMQGDGFWL